MDADEALALRLHEEMNGAGDSDAGERRRVVRARTRPLPKRTRELRASSRNNSTSDLRSRTLAPQPPPPPHAISSPAAGKHDLLSHAFAVHQAEQPECKSASKPQMLTVLMHTSTITS